MLPKRTANGIDYNRLYLLVAVLEKKAGMMLGGQDIYLNVVGGLKINEPSIDLGILAATASSFKNIAISKDTVITFKFFFSFILMILNVNLQKLV